MEFESRYKILSSISLSSFCMRAFASTSVFLRSSSSGISFTMNVPSIWSSSPEGVIVKFSSDTFTATSGG